MGALLQTRTTVHRLIRAKTFPDKPKPVQPALLTQTSPKTKTQNVVQATAKPKVGSLASPKS